jgi:hypothetical protein
MSRSIEATSSSSVWSRANRSIASVRGTAPPLSSLSSKAKKRVEKFGEGTVGKIEDVAAAHVERVL